MQYILIVLFSVTNVFANEATDLANNLHYMKSYNNALHVSQKEKKLLMLIIVENGCHWCKKFARTTLMNPAVQQKQKAIIKVIIDKDDQAALQYEPHFFPMIYFINPKTQQVVDTAYGYQKTTGFLMHIQKANEQYKKESLK